MNISSIHLVANVSNHDSIEQLLMLLSFPILAPSGSCCDNCVSKEATALSTLSHPTSSETVDSSTPSKTVNLLRKRPMCDTDLGPICRREQHREDARAALQKWRVDTWFTRYHDMHWGFEGLMLCSLHLHPMLAGIVSRT
jgi:hypothetical protein